MVVLKTAVAAPSLYVAYLLSLAQFVAHTSCFLLRYHALETSLFTMATLKIFLVYWLSLARFVAHTSWFPSRHHETSMVTVAAS